MGGMTTTNPPKSAKRSSSPHLRASDVHAVTQLALDATHAVTDMAQGVHQSVLRTLGAPNGDTPAQARGLTGLIYKSIHAATRLIGHGVTRALTQLEPLLARLDHLPGESPERAAVIAALNGVMGDRLQASASPLATPMTLRHEGVVLNAQGIANLSGVTGKVLLVIHGLCMNELQWSRRQGAHTVNHASALAQAFGYTPIYVRYNSGLHISQNGHALAQQLETLVRHWPTPISEITVLAHSMGGLVIRSAVHAASQAGLQWPKQLKNIIFLGTPHHGAPLERAGNWVDVLLGSTPYSRPFAKLGQLRSAGVTDLRYGLLLDQDWQGHDRFRRQPDRRQPVALPENVACFAVAATTAAKRSAVADRLLGDGLVPPASALGQHADAARHLHFAPERQHMAYRTSHLQLLSSPAITQQLLQWLA